MISALNRTTAPQILRFFDVCFKRGVIDAMDYGDDLDTREFLQARKNEWSLGILGKEDSSWQFFCSNLYWWARNAKLMTLAEKYFFALRKKDLSWCLLPYCMQFYLLGIEEWLDYPNPANIEIFKSTPKLHWSPKGPIKKFIRPDYFSYLHNFYYQYSQIPEDLQTVSPTMMDSFVSAIYDLSSRYGKRKRI